ncbi:Uncharacterised protein [Vibrio cholerae]|nr:Uncharacterised protein [Vibrio cholerae]
MALIDSSRSTVFSPICTRVSSCCAHADVLPNSPAIRSVNGFLFMVGFLILFFLWLACVMRPEFRPQ